jgi:hypothetical protein
MRIAAQAFLDVSLGKGSFRNTNATRPFAKSLSHPGR